MTRNEIINLARQASTGAAPLAIFSIEELETYTSLVLAHNRAKPKIDVTCPKGMVAFECEVEGVELLCFLEYTPEEEGSRDSRGLLNEPGTYENMELVNAYVKGTDVDIAHLLLQYLVDHITTTALEDMKNDDL
jgi:hypothetical protein